MAKLIHSNIPAFSIRFLIVSSIVCVLLNQRVIAQQIEPVYLSISDGLVSPTVNDVIQDKYGIIWIGTSNGVQKYDGYKLETFKNIAGKSVSLQNNEIWGLAEDSKGNVWVANAQGVSRYDRIKNAFTNYPFAKNFNIAPDGGRVFKIFIDSKDRVWAASQNLEILQYNSATDQWKYADYKVPEIEQPSHFGFSIAFTEDSKGGVWTGSTNYGLMHCPVNSDTLIPVSAEALNGFNFVQPNNTITALFSDSSNTLWITTRNGVYKYNPDAGTFKTIIEYTEAQTDIWNNLNCIQQDNDGNIWIANNFRGILKFEGTSDSFQEIVVEGKVRMRGRGWNGTITDFIIDRSGIIWFGTRESGLLKYDPVNKPFSVLVHDDNDPGSISPNGVYGILASKVKPGIVYVGTRGSGLNIYDPKKKNFAKVTFQAIDDRFGGSVRSIAENSDGSLWLGTWGDGLIKLDQNNREVTRYKYETKTTNTISNNQVRVIMPERQDRIWVGTNNGLNIFNPQTGTFQRVLSKLTRNYPAGLIDEIEKIATTDKKVGIIDKVLDNQNISQQVVIETDGTYFVMAVGEGDLSGMVDFGWIETAAKDTVWSFGTHEESFYAGGAAKNRIVIAPIALKAGNYMLRYRTDDSHSYDSWNEAAPDQTSLYGIVLIKPDGESQAKTLESILNQNRQELVLSGNDIADIHIDEKYIWVATFGNGLNRIDQATNTVKYFEFDPLDDNTLSSNVILDICKDKNGMLWLATDDGINKLDPTTEKCTRYLETDGLPTNLTQSIVEGDNGEMWIATQNGLSQMVTNEALGKVTFINYNSSDGLGGDVFLSLAAARAKDGRFYFGGDHGLTTFSSITANNIPPELIISNLLISNKSVLDMGEDSPLQTSLLETKSIELSYQQNSLSFEFAALHFANPSKNQYAHMLKGYDNDWIYDNRNFASYTNLDPGEYEFAIRAANAYGIWNEEGKSVTIIILPPWWQTWWAYGIYALLFVLTFFAFDRLMRRRLVLRERERSREKELAQAREIEKAYTELKATQSQLIQSEKMASLGELTAGIAHEIQNPLNFVNNFADVSRELIGEMNEELAKGDFQSAKEVAMDIGMNLEKIYHHGQRASSIVRGMLEHSRAGNGEKELTDINALADEYLRLAYHGLRAKDKSFQAEFKSDFDKELPKIQVVPQDFGRVLLNLINNAFYAVDKKTKSGIVNYKPEVTIKTKKNGNSIELSVKDNGSGIPASIKDKIFQPFFTTKPAGQGTGLGLSISYDIITKGHNGSLEVKSLEGSGTEFIIVLPYHIN